MLAKLYIRNYVIIDELEILFSEKLNIITGETGAGKSIIAGALGLVLGHRADTSVLLHKEKKCVVEGTFQLSGHLKLQQFLQDHLPGDEIVESGELMIRREITGNGKSRSFLNDSPVTLALLQQCSSLLVDLHQQFGTLELADTDFQRQVLDALAGNAALLDAYRQLFQQWQQQHQETEALKEQKRQFDKETDYNRFQFQELEEAGFRENELEDAEAELKILQHAEGIAAALSSTCAALKYSDMPLIQQLKMLQQQLAPYTAVHPRLSVLMERLQSAQIELQDIADDARQISNQVQYDPQRAELLNDRLSLGYKLQKKHAAHSTAELLSIQQQLEEKLQAVLHIDDRISQNEQKTAMLLAQATAMASRISGTRRKQVKPMEDQVNKLLQQVGMPNAVLRVEMAPSALSSSGADQVSFLFDANQSGQFLPVGKVASGGELGRLMLCIKSLVARSLDMPTLIFDEIDTGISGEAAKQVGIIMKSLSENRQLICITHQPQIAGRADAHFLVYKETANKEVKTGIRLLSEEERIITIARMLSGEKPTAAAIANARELIK